MKEYMLTPAVWHTPEPKRKRKPARGPTVEIAKPNPDGVGWPVFIPKHYTPAKPKRERKPKRVLTDEEQRAVWRAQAKRYYHEKMTPEAKTKRAAQHKAMLKAHPEKRHEYNARYIAKHGKHYTPKPREGHGPDGRFLPGKDHPRSPHRERGRNGQFISTTTTHTYNCIP